MSETEGRAAGPEGPKPGLPGDAGAPQARPDPRQTFGLLAGEAEPFAAAVRATRMPMIICDALAPDMPIVFANDAFLQSSGYDADFVIGRNCRFLQGPGTDRETVRRLSDAIARRTDIHVELLNYRRDGSQFWNALYVSPVRNADGEVRFFFGSQMDVTLRKETEMRLAAEKAAIEAAVHERTASLQAALEARNVLLHEVDHRVKNNLQTIAALVAMEARGVTDGPCRAAFTRLARRTEAVATVHRRLYEAETVDRFDVVEFARALVTQLTGSLPVAIDARFAGPPILVPAGQASPLALILNELLLEAASGSGPVTLSIARVAAGRFRIEVSPLGATDAVAGSTGGVGSPNLIERLVRQLRAELTRTDGTAALAVPCEAAA